jgi:hypothetical protein
MENESGYSPEASATAGHNAPVVFLHNGAVWRYYAQTNDLGTAWRSNTFNDAAWPSGPAMLGFGDANGLLPATVVASNRQWTTYFRRAFVVPDASLVLNLTSRIQRDDAAVVYLNGAEVWRDPNLPSGAISNPTPALSGLSGAAESAWLTNALPPAALVTGTNLLAVEVHQNSQTSSDLAFDFALSATVFVPSDARLNLGSEGGQMALSWPAEGAYLGLHSATNLRPPVAWAPFPAAPVLSHGRWTVSLPAPTNSQRFFRLASP